MHFKLEIIDNIDKIDIYRICIYCLLEDKEVIIEEIPEKPKIVDNKEIHYFYLKNIPDVMYEKIISEINVNDEYNLCDTVYIDSYIDSIKNTSKNKNN